MRWTLCLALLPLSAAPLGAQDAFEIQVYEYETVPAGRWSLETHFNFTGKGTTASAGAVAPTQHQAHLTFELTRGVTPTFEMAAYLVLADRPGAGPEFAGWRLRPRIRAPDAWRLPVKLSLSLEAGFPRPQYEEASATLEVRPVIERTFGRWQADMNPVLGRALSGAGSGAGWDFEPGARLAFAATRRLDLSVEYYGALGSPTNPRPSAQQIHQFFLGGDLELSEDVVTNFGIGFGATDAGSGLVYKARLGWLF